MKNNQQRQLLDLVDLYSSLQIKKKKKHAKNKKLCQLQLMAITTTCFTISEKALIPCTHKKKSSRLHVQQPVYVTFFGPLEYYKM